MSEAMILNEKELEIISGGRNEGRYDYVPDSCGGFVDQYKLKVGQVYWRNDYTFDCSHTNNHWSKVMVERVWEEPHKFLFIKYTERMVTYINLSSGERVTRLAKGSLQYCNE